MYTALGGEGRGGEGRGGERRGGEGRGDTVKQYINRHVKLKSFPKWCVDMRRLCASLLYA